MKKNLEYWSKKLDNTLVVTVQKLIDKTKKVNKIGDSQEIVIANILIATYNNHHTTIDRGIISYRKKT